MKHYAFVYNYVKQNHTFMFPLQSAKTVAKVLAAAYVGVSVIDVVSVRSKHQNFWHTAHMQLNDVISVCTTDKIATDTYAFEQERPQLTKMINDHVTESTQTFDDIKTYQQKCTSLAQMFIESAHMMNRVTLRSYEYMNKLYALRNRVIAPQYYSKIGAHVNNSYVVVSEFNKDNPSITMPYKVNCGDELANGLIYPSWRDSSMSKTPYKGVHSEFVKYVALQNSDLLNQQTFTVTKPNVQEFLHTYKPYCKADEHNMQMLQEYLKQNPTLTFTVIDMTNSGSIFDLSHRTMLAI